MSDYDRHDLPEDPTLDDVVGRGLFAYVEATRLLCWVFETVDDEDEHERVHWVIHMLALPIVQAWQSLSDEAQVRFVDEYPEHGGYVQNCLLSFASVTGADLAEMAGTTRAAEEVLRVWKQRRDEEGES